MCKRIASLLLLPLSIATLVFAAFTAAPTTANAIEWPTSECLMNNDVIDTYYQYYCPNGYIRHNFRYNYTYKLLTFKSGYKATQHEVISTWKAKNCDCGKGTVNKVKVHYHTW